MLLLGFCATLVSVASLAWLGPQAQLRRRLGGVRAFALPSIEELTTSATAAPVPTIGDFDELGSDDFDHGPVGVLLLTKGAPETPDDVEQYLVNVFCDPEILTLPPSLSLFKRPLAAFIAKSKAEEARVAMEIAGGRSPQMTTIRAQADALQLQLAERGVDARLYIAARYWSPYADEVIEDMKREGIQKLVIIPIYPQFSISTSGSSLRVLEQLMYTDPGFPAKSSVVPAWYNRRGFLEATAEGIQQTLVSLPDPEKAHVLYTAQGLPRKYIDDLNDPYQGQVERTVELVTKELAARGAANSHSLSYQGALGPSQLSWIGPSTSDEIEGLARRGKKELVLVPISFVFEHMGTLNEIDREYAELAASVGITSFARVPTLGVAPKFVDMLATVVMEALPDLSRASFSQINEGEPVCLNMVNEYTRLYAKDELRFVPQEQPWGFTEAAERLNGRLAMMSITVAAALALDPTLKLMVATYRAAKGIGLKLPLVPVKLADAGEAAQGVLGEAAQVAGEVGEVAREMAGEVAQEVGGVLADVGDAINPP